MGRNFLLRIFCASDKEFDKKDLEIGAGAFVCLPRRNSASNGQNAFQKLKEAVYPRRAKLFEYIWYRNYKEVCKEVKKGLSMMGFVRNDVFSDSSLYSALRSPHSVAFINPKTLSVPKISSCLGSYSIIQILGT